MVMKQTIRNILPLLAVILLPVGLLAQNEEKDKEKVKEKSAKDVQNIIITRSSDNKDEKVVVEIKGDKITINGKPIEEFKDGEGDVKVRVQKFKEMEGLAWSPRTPNAFSGADQFKVFSESSNSAMLGVSTEKADGGVVVNDVTDESAAEKIGLKEGDIITKIDDAKIEDPDDLSAAVKKHKPGDKVTVYWLRDKKEQKAIAELTKWKGASLFMNGQNLNMDLGNLDMLRNIPRVNISPNMNRSFGQNWNWSGNGPKLGLSVQDTDDGKGVKVIDVDEESNAAKAGIKEDDVIQEVDGKAVNSTDDMVKMIRESKEKISVMMKVVQGGKSKNIEVKMPRRIKTADL